MTTAQKVVIWSFPTRILFGVGSAARTGEEAKRLGASRALIVTDKGVVKAGLSEPVERSLREAGVEPVVFDDVLGNPIEKNVHDGVKAYRDAGADMIVALGGGSPLDVGKLVRLGVNHTRPLVDYDDATGGDQFITSNVPGNVGLWSRRTAAATRRGVAHETSCGMPPASLGVVAQLVPDRIGASN